ncbi:hypothetical protein BB561_001830 [Smittium simulii]|uniref:Ubiquitin carboxyl-terminal hydrolase n=1 Tax=Smittium simulii TaxID=133385 RepID=A0A2T9YSS7_9FUNG|nr:hypothetical protein BB561_001830 [Smittium simulii]
MKKSQLPAFSIQPDLLDLSEIDLLFSNYPIYIPETAKEIWLKNNSTNVTTKLSDPEKKQPSSWASLFNNSDVIKQKPNSSVYSIDKTTTSINKTQNNNKKKTSLKDLLINWSLKPSPVLLVPRGLVNSGNMCFMNVALQALVYCKYFAALLYDIKKHAVFSFDSQLPLIESFELEVVIPSTGSDAIENQEPFVPEYVYNALRQKKIFQTTRGQQEDAQEFLGHMLNGIHDEILYVINSNGGILNSIPTNYAGFASPKIHSTDYSYNGSSEDNNINQSQQTWLEVGPKNKLSTTREIEYAQTPITLIFGGYLRSELKIQGVKPSITKEPYQFLALDISNSNIITLEDALDQLFAIEHIEGYTNSLKCLAEASKQLSLDSLPQVFIFILNRVVFSPDLGVHKLNKFISYPEMFTIFDRWLSPSSKLKYSKSKYKLTSVLYHHGDSATGGHYTSEIMRQTDEWIRFDDTEVLSDLSISTVLEEKDDHACF